jgi:YHS domain-containing protein
MFSSIFKILVFVLVIWMLRRVLALFLGSGKRADRGNTAKNAENYMVKDPVCGMYMDSRLAVRLEKGKEPIYFCSEDCKNRFLEKASEEKSASEANG